MFDPELVLYADFGRCEFETAVSRVYNGAERASGLCLPAPRASDVFASANDACGVVQHYLIQLIAKIN